jgi:hypothetical protein
LVCVTLLGVVGCGDSGPPTGKVTGKVTYNGNPVNGGSVFFALKKGGAGTGTIAEDGTYTAQVPLGEATVTVNPPPAKDPKAPLPFPKKYVSAGTSGLTCEVKSGSNTFDISMSGSDGPTKGPKKGIR